MKSLLRGSLVGGMAVFAMAMGPTPGQADVFVYTINADNLGVDCSGPSGCGKVTLTTSGTTYTFDVDLTAASGLTLHTTTGGTGNPDTVAFNLAGATTPTTGPVTFDSGPVNGMDGFGTFLKGVDCSVTTGSNACSPTGVSPSNDFIFSVTAPVGEQLTRNTQGFFLALDVCSGACSLGNTGFAASSVPGPIVGAGLPGLLAACGGLLALARRRRARVA
jgi:hypothetical protein